MLIRRLDHPIVCVHSREDLVRRLDKVLGLRPQRRFEHHPRGFSNAEVDIGDGFLGIVEPSGEDSQLDRFLARFPEGLYGISVDVGDVGKAASFFDDRGIPYASVKRDTAGVLYYLPPRSTHGVLYQICSGRPPAQGTNPSYLGVSAAMIAVHDLEKAVRTYQHVFDVGEPQPTESEHLGYRGALLAIPGAALRDVLVLAEPTREGGPVAQHLRKRGEGLFQFTIEVQDLESEVKRLRARGAALEVEPVAGPAQLAWIDPLELGGVCIELRDHTSRSQRADS
jgi:Glyoxalase/Bleomycin resistance protein/Dioxygenase superfamily